MIGIVLVSHSKALGEALADLVQQVSTEPIRIAVAAGAGEDYDEFGTDTLQIMQAIEQVYEDDGVLLLMDLGSAILSAEMAVELLPPEMQEKILFCPAPLIEGAIAAGVQAGLGSDLETACQEARGALLPKQEQLGFLDQAQPAQEPEEPRIDADTAQQVTLTLRNQYGLHARPAARFVQTAASFDAVIQVTNLTKNKGPVSAKSLNALATLGAVKDHQIEIIASGAQASAALDSLSALVEDNFGEEQVSGAIETAGDIKRPSAEPGALAGIPIAEGIALGPLYQFRPPPPTVPAYPADDPDLELNRLQEAINTVRKSIQKQRRQIAMTAGEDQAGIFEAHELILIDPDLFEGARTNIQSDQMNAAAAWQARINQVAEQYRSLDDPYLQGRAADVIDVGNQVLFELAGEPGNASIEFNHPVILVAEELTPTQTAQLDLDQVEGVITLLGGPTSHSAILARSLGIPAVTGVPASVLRLPDDTRIALDGSRGSVWIEPPDDLRAQLQDRRKQWISNRESLIESSQQPAITRDGHQVEVVANVGSLEDARSAVKNGAEGIGLLRTEFLFLTRNEPPAEEEQYQALLDIASQMGDHPVIVRTLDVGGDKELPYIELPDEANPFLGVRAIRLSLKKTSLFKDQLRAILRTSAQASIRIMFPMVAEMRELIQAKQMLEDVHLALSNEGIAHSWPVETGIMIEVPSAALMAPALAERADFFSIGTNDLTQYTLAAERGNPELSTFADGLHPAVLRLIDMVVRGAHSHKRWVGVCGELAGDPAAAPLLVGLGVDELSMNAAVIPRVKAAIRSINLVDAVQLASRALELSDAASVRQIATEFIEQIHT